MSTKPSRALLYAARRAVSNEFFLAGILHEYQQANALSDEDLASFLHCKINDLPRLALCRRPSQEQRQFLRDIERLAQRFHLQTEGLAAVIRQVEALRAVRGHLAAVQDSQGMLRAARDRDDDEAVSPDASGEDEHD